MQSSIWNIIFFPKGEKRNYPQNNRFMLQLLKSETGGWCAFNKQ
uniref:Uncharacterized protein n=1 Tax=Rhizophora mucronata TaxID=61149 RepID=A0A2P2LFQ5_RHIMU